MKKITFAFFALTLASVSFAQTYNFKAVNEIDVEMPGGTLVVAASPEKGVSASIENLDKTKCYAVIKEKRKEIEVKIKKIDPSAICKPNIKIIVNVKAKLSVEAANTNIFIDSMSKKTDLDIKTSTAKLDNVSGKLDIEAVSSTVDAKGSPCFVELETYASAANISWLGKETPAKVILKGDGVVTLSTPKDTKYLKIIKQNFRGTLIEQNTK
ncbi:hypothetical protein Emin_1539 [Elusimicrobium minutum Pei191]|uniref:Auto-transporter adhesin head GIN domain-containing protein n=1 Tax=Elusimicrobium minutum (strain Pei191) TaxID=445932 RepID=B2KEZ0_ELUMP|nr:hypothetical protein [Elusimicrobium minutum]ACC99086.1 hypothetical protein Emin_1539 [Elusimicrobium minutum Pei191]